MTKKALILNGLTRNSLAITRSLHRRGVIVHGAMRQSGHPHYDRMLERNKSRFIEKLWFWDEKNKLSDVMSLLEREHYDYLFAGGTNDSLFIARHKPEFNVLTKVVSEDLERVMRVHDKFNLNREAHALGIPVPATYVVPSVQSLRQELPPFQPPYVLKFPDSFASKGLKTYSGSREGLADFFEVHFGDMSELPIVQQLIQGPLVDTCAFSVKGEAKAVLSQQRILTAWIDGGGGIVNETIYAPKLLEYTRRLLAHFQWSGHLELDWIYSERDDEYYLIEINPKYWGTTQLTIDAGYDFPAMSLDLMDGKEIPDQGKFRVGLRYRWLDDEINTLLWNSKSTGEKWMLWLAFFGRFFHFRTHYNTRLLSDPRPFLINLRSTATDIARRFLRGKRGASTT